ncbi:MAG: DMT family transporter [Bacteroidia bacterium]|nr:DMT family transporter [Bacteroidia bacterium]
MNNSNAGHIALLVAQVIYAMNYSIAKDLMPDFLGPHALVFLRVVGAAVLFWILSLFVKNEKVEKADMKKIFLLTFVGVLFNQLFFIWGLSLTEPINSAIIMISNPIMVFVFAVIVLKASVNIYNISGLALAIAGSLIILLFKGNFEFGSRTVIGDLMTLVNSTSWAIFVVMSKPLYSKYSPVTVMKWMFLFGSILVLPIGGYDIVHTNWQAFTSDAIYATAFVIVATTFLAYLLNIYGLQQLSPHVVSMYIYLQPFLASLFAISLGKDNLNLTKIVAGIFIILGLYLVNVKTKKVQND